MRTLIRKAGIRTFIGTAVLASLTAAGPAEAIGFVADPPRRDIDMCVAAVRDRADYSGAGEVRHEVVSTKRRTVGYSIGIETTVREAAGGSVLREYRSVCVATGGRSPSRFEITRTGGA